MCFIIAVVGLVGMSFLYIKCDTPNIAGVNAPYLKQGSSSYSNCACVAETDNPSGGAKNGNCYVDCGLKFILFMAILALSPCMTFMNDTPAYIVTLRQKTLS
ncbi:hypothetical protein OS493_038940 [Desmophyllum pertusum]|uniref:Uncharacterized protein n=1 Tax=Desmophyllum pertusum TaxID=174260 RepID=A0A9W9ZWJ0_9CNID|nr:hypothetical protein OS493_038940 [Desmophyllum pertusum]